MPESEAQSNTINQRPTIEILKNEINSGKVNIYEVIEALMKEDSSALHARCLLRAEGVKVEALNKEIMDLYEIRSEKHSTPLEDNLNFAEGFDYVADIYSILTKASRLDSELDPKLTPEQEAGIIGLPKELQEKERESTREKNFSTEEARIGLISDSSGISWLEQRMRQRYGKDRYFEFLGADSAIKGIDKLYGILAPKAPGAPSQQ